MKLQGRTIYRGQAAGAALVSNMGISFFGGVEPDSGVVVEKDHDLQGQCITDRVLV
ncbi:MAG: DUF126 domain-containing protein, partial [Anaerolineaceae bacterium]|nr:DUF126 domain-containing protein [Anaerolineaceae bacterium]